MTEEDKRIEDLVNKLMAADSLEQAPVNFTDNVMDRVEAFSNSTPIVYRPLISKTVWCIIALGFIILLCYLVFKQPTSNMSLIDKFNLLEVSFNPLENLSFDFSPTLTYAMALLAIMFSIQVPLLKQYFNNRMTY